MTSRLLGSVAFGVLAAVLVAGCTLGDLTAVSDGFNEAPSNAILDGSVDGGNEHFYFLPPMVRAPDFVGEFAPDVAPEIRIVAPDEADIVLYPSLEDEHFHANWDTKSYDLDAEKIYRIRVLVDGFELGYADVQLVSNGSEFKNVTHHEFVPLIDGRTLPIKFRVERGALPAIVPIEVVLGEHEIEVMSPADTISVGERVMLTAVVTGPEGEALESSVRWGSSNPGRAVVSGTGEVEARAAGEVVIVAAYAGKAGAKTLYVR